MFMYFFHQAPDYGSHTILSKFLRPEHIPLYQFTLDCVIPIASRNRTQVRTGHLFLMYAMVHHRPLNLGFITFSWIHSRHILLHSDRVFMPYCYFITAYLESLRMDISKVAIKKLEKSAKVGKGNMI
ncbi:hypothetical protein AXF42_Ash007516 [Apostasia shenzhenica]|uniref:Uncharacterized protein n=1 Tax=Apostasia shenzhenica TaxID=1088818 RepID=A0A2I0A5P2_9ASPA|nr:hypothetical protein AXF42_Ash007516 [Apostasia shenzhenica]